MRNLGWEVDWIKGTENREQMRHKMKENIKSIKTFIIVKSPTENII